MKATTKRLVDRHFEVKGTADYNEQKVETYSKINNKWIFLGWSIPAGLVYNVVGTKAGIFLEEKIQLENIDINYTLLIWHTLILRINTYLLRDVQLIEINDIKKGK